MSTVAGLSASFHGQPRFQAAMQALHPFTTRVCRAYVFGYWPVLLWPMSDVEVLLRPLSVTHHTYHLDTTSHPFIVN